jgi:hypothetical protein
LAEIVADIVLAILCVPVAIYTILWVAADIRAGRRLRREIEATRRVETINGQEYSVSTQIFDIVREKRTGRIGLAMERGAERDPTTVAGKLAMVPRWIEVQFVRKTDGKIGRVEWRRFQSFEIVGETNVDFLVRRLGLFKSETFVRYPHNFAGDILPKTKAPRRGPMWEA